MAIYAPQFQSASLQFITETQSCALRHPAEERKPRAPPRYRLLVRGGDAAAPFGETNEVHAALG